MNRAVTETIARAFAANLAATIGEANMRAVVAKNATPKYHGCCASHDYCDANIVMQDTLEACGVSVWNDDDMNDAAIALFNAAWTLARKSGFYLEE